MNILDCVDDRFFREVFINNVYPVIKADVVFDIGALALEYSIRVYPYSNKIIALEPHPKHAERIKDILATGYLPKIQFYQLALAKNSGIRRFGKLETYGGSVLMDGINSIEVESITIGSLMEKVGVDHIDVFKMDIEGGEGEVLINDFPYDKVDNIFLEIHSGLSHLNHYLETKGYKVETNKEICIARKV